MSILNGLYGEPREEVLEGDLKLLILKGEVKFFFHRFVSGIEVTVGIPFNSHEKGVKNWPIKGRSIRSLRFIFFSFYVSFILEKDFK